MTFVLWLWEGWRPVYTAKHVNAMARMLRIYGPKDADIICFTDIPEGVTECETRPMFSPLVKVNLFGKQNCFSRLNLFNPEISESIGGRIVSVDLDAIIMKNLCSLLCGKDTFAGVKGVSARINGSMWYLDAGSNSHVWQEFDPVESPKEISRYKWGDKLICGSDQAWLSMKIPEPKLWSPEDGVLPYPLFSDCPERLIDSTIIFFSGDIKPWSDQIENSHPVIWEQYRRFYDA